MYAARKFLRESGIYRAMTINPGLAAERVRYNIHAVMRLAAWSVPGMACMQVGFIFDAQAFGRESFSQFLYDDIFGLHIAAYRMLRR